MRCTTVSSSADRRRRFLIEADMPGGAAAIRIEVEGGPLPDTWRGAGPETVVRTLRACFGSAAVLRFASTGTVHVAELRFAPPGA